MLRIVFLQSLAVASALGLQTAGNAELQSLRGKVDGVVEEMGKLTARVDHLTELVRSNMAREQIEITFGDKSPTLLTPIRETLFIGPGFGLLTASTTFNEDFTQLQIEYEYHDIRITNNMLQARQHFASVLPFEHLIGTPAMRELRAYLPITPRDQEKCEKIFALLAEHPPAEYERGIKWIGYFHRVANEKMGPLVVNWNRKQRM
ncbi:hypothetical protein FOZ61_004688 [Perkinsus olseni]|uniref:Uncharacterized protein n=1 Tax=Perkinsus olseni TaxID=32597 RepID=A0A7J6LJP6_PEROL|nr:hypothetical protein FOZ61_004688 [Perkinsus olseni]